MCPIIRRYSLVGLNTMTAAVGSLGAFLVVTLDFRVQKNTLVWRTRELVSVPHGLVITIRGGSVRQRGKFKCFYDFTSN